MKVIATFEDNKPILVERFNDAGLNVGARKVHSVDFARSMLGELPVGTILEHLSESVLTGHFEQTDEYYVPDFTHFMTRLLNTVPLNMMKQSEYRETFEQLANACFERLAVMNLQEKETLKLLKSVIDALNLDAFDAFDVELNYLAKGVFNKLLNSHNPSNVKTLASLQKIIRNRVAASLENEEVQSEQSKLEKEIEKFMPYVSDDWMFEQFQSKRNDSPRNSILMTAAIPKGCSLVSVGTKYNSYVFEIPKTQLRVKYGNVAYENVGHPRLLFVVKAQGDKIVNLSLVAVRADDELNEDMPLYYYPFSHVYADGRVCWSGYTQRDFDQMWLLPQEFLSASNSNHMAPRTRELYEALQNKNFNDDDLKLFEGKRLKHLLS